MSSTAVNADSGSEAKGAARRTRASRSSACQLSSATMATICWASTSSGLDGIRSASMAPCAHPLGDDGRLHQVAAVLGEDHPGGHRADLVPGPAHPLQPRGHGRRRLDLDHQVDRAHVDPELQAGGGDHGGQPSRLEVLLDLGALLLGHRAVVGAGEDGRRALAPPRTGP